MGKYSHKTNIRELDLTKIKFRQACSRKRRELGQVNPGVIRICIKSTWGWSIFGKVCLGVIKFSSNQLEKYRKREDRFNEEKFSLSLDSNLASIWLSPLDRERSSSSLHSNLASSWSSPLDKKKTLSSQHGEPFLPNNQWEAVVCVHCKLFELHIRFVRVLSRRKGNQWSRNLKGGVPEGGYSVFSAT